MILCEPICDGAQHIPFNSATIKGVLNLVAGDVRILCTHSHWQALMKELDEKNILRIRHIPINTLTRKDDLKSWLSSFRLLLKIKNIVKSQENILFLSSTSGIIDLASSIFRSNSVKCIVHMLLARVELPIPRNPVTRFFSLNSVLKRFQAENTQIVVLEEVIKGNLQKMYPRLEDKVTCLVHPLPSEEELNVAHDTSSQRSICFPGTFSEEKGAYEFIRLALSYTDTSDFIFKVAGRKSVEIEPEQEKAFSVLPVESFLPRQSFTDLTSNSDFLFLGHHPETYKWCASGVYNDALHFGVPIIARKSDFLVSEFRKYGELGFLYESIEQVNEFLTSNDYSTTHKMFISNIEKAKKTRTSQFLAELTNIVS